MNNKKTLIIAEAGVNHNGSIKNAKKLIDVASDAGADIIKFQTFSPEDIVLRNTTKAQYQRKGSKRNQTQYQMLKKLELKFSEHIELFKYCKKKKIEFLSTAFDFKSINLLKKLRLKRNKIPSGEITNYPYLKEIAKISKPILLSTGMASYTEIKHALLLLNRNFQKDITLLHCVSNYPTTKDDVNLNVMLELEKRFSYPVGFSDHTIGNFCATAAVMMGAVVIEKHVTSDKTLPGPDHKVSLTIEEFSELVNQIRISEQVLGKKEKWFSKDEIEIKKSVRKSIVAKNDLLAGSIISQDDICFKRPGTGISPLNRDIVIGSKVKHSIEKDRVLKQEDIIEN